MPLFNNIPVWADIVVFHMGGFRISRKHIVEKASPIIEKLNKTTWKLKKKSLPSLTIKTYLHETTQSQLNYRLQTKPKNPAKRDNPTTKSKDNPNATSTKTKLTRIL